MIPLEEVLRLLDQLRSEVLELVEKPRERDAFAFGEASASLRMVAEMRQRFEALVADASKGEDEID